MLCLAAPLLCTQWLINLIQTNSPILFHSFPSDAFTFTRSHHMHHTSTELSVIRVTCHLTSSCKHPYN